MLKTFSRRIAAALPLVLLSCALAFAQVQPGQSPLSVAKGGSGRSTLTAHSLIFGNGTSPVTMYGCAGFLVGTGSGADPLCRVIAGADLPNPSSSSLGGVQSKSCTTSQWISSISTLGVPSCSQPAASDLSGGQAVTRTDDTNVTLTLGGTPTTAALQPFSMTLGWTGQLGVSRGGTGAASFTAHGVLLGEGTSAVAPTAAMTDGQILVGQTSTDPLPKTASGDCTISAAAAFTCTKTNGSAFVASATTDTTNASNISSGTLNTARLPSPFTSGTRSGNTSVFGTTSGTLTSGNCVKIDASGNLVDAGAACGTGGGGAGLTNFVDLTQSPYSAACDGSTDDSTAIQSWLTAIAGGAGEGYVPTGKTCVFNGLLSISTNTTIWGYGATFKLKNAGNSNSGFVCGPTSQAGGPIDTFRWFGVSVDGNRTNQTNTKGGGALLYCVSTTNFVIRDANFNNGRGDGLYIGGDSSGAGQSVYVNLYNVSANNNYRNNMSVVGAIRMNVFGGKFNSASNTNNDGPQCGIDFEPNGSTTKNAGIHLYGVTANGNGYASFSGSGGSGICVYNSASNTTDLVLDGVDANSNLKYGIDVASGFASSNVRIAGTTGTGNGSGLVNTANIRDFFPSGISLEAPDSGGTGYRLMIVPN